MIKKDRVLEIRNFKSTIPIGTQVNISISGITQTASFDKTSKLYLALDQDYDDMLYSEQTEITDIPLKLSNTKALKNSLMILGFNVT